MYGIPAPIGEGEGVYDEYSYSEELRDAIRQTNEDESIDVRFLLLRFFLRSSLMKCSLVWNRR
jgi:hypothetical protein